MGGLSGSATVLHVPVRADLTALAGNNLTASIGDLDLPPDPALQITVKASQSTPD